ncbi:MAG: helix-turn-helix transcriptional regulator [Pararhodobacter sp.]|nr:helix-turn-helix transcriptional regulator [Pararhodobacter sp.]
MREPGQPPDRRLVRQLPPRLARLGVILIVLQAGCAVFFAVDVTTDLMLYRRIGASMPFSVHLTAEALATLSLVVAIALELRLVLWLLRRQALLEQDLALAGAAVEQVVLNRFEHWRLTGAEQDVARFVVKGLTIAEIAVLRGSSEATVKSHLNAIYRKSGSTGRPDLLAQILETLMGPPDRDGAGAEPL